LHAAAHDARDLLPNSLRKQLQRLEVAEKVVSHLCELPALLKDLASCLAADTTPTSVVYDDDNGDTSSGPPEGKLRVTHSRTVISPRSTTFVGGTVASTVPKYAVNSSDSARKRCFDSDDGNAQQCSESDGCNGKQCLDSDSCNGKQRLDPDGCNEQQCTLADGCHEKQCTEITTLADEALIEDIAHRLFSSYQERLCGYLANALPETCTSLDAVDEATMQGVVELLIRKGSDVLHGLELAESLNAKVIVRLHADAQAEANKLFTLALSSRARPQTQPSHNASRQV